MLFCFTSILIHTAILLQLFFTCFRKLLPPIFFKSKLYRIIHMDQLIKIPEKRKSVGPQSFSFSSCVFNLFLSIDDQLTIILVFPILRYCCFDYAARHQDILLALFFYSHSPIWREQSKMLALTSLSLLKKYGYPLGHLSIQVKLYALFFLIKEIRQDSVTICFCNLMLYFGSGVPIFSSI